MNNVDSLFFRGIYQVGVPITRSFRSVVPPGKMRPEIAMHLCALVEIGRGRVYISPSFSSPRAFSILSLLLRSALRCPDCPRASSIADFHPFPLPRIGSTSILRHPAYIAGGDRIIVRRISVRFLRGANKTDLRASRVSYGPSCANTHAYLYIRALRLARVYARVYVRRTNIAQYCAPSRWNRI